jgi:iron complex transport system permease protein
MRNNKAVVLFLTLLALLIISFLVGLSFGNAKIPLKEIVAVLQAQLFSNIAVDAGVQGPVHDIVWLLRMPRIILAVCVGAGLSVCGLIMQAVVRNPLADPYILGVSSGASLGATLAILLGIGISLGENYIGLAAFGGALFVSIAILLISNIGGTPNTIKLLLAGMAINAICSSFSSFIVYFANNMEGMQTISYWLMGSLSSAKWSLLYVLCPIILFGSLFFWSQAKVLNIMLLGDDVALTLGYDLNFYRQVYLLVSAILVGFIVYSAGIIGFVGLIVPHIVRMLIGSDHVKLIPIVSIVGAVFLIWADLLCRIILVKSELPIGILISMIGAPCFIYLIAKKAYKFQE